MMKVNGDEGERRQQVNGLMMCERERDSNETKERGESQQHCRRERPQVNGKGRHAYERAIGTELVSQRERERRNDRMAGEYIRVLGTNTGCESELTCEMWTSVSGIHKS